MDSIRFARAVAGLLSVVVLLTVIVGHVFVSDVAASPSVVSVLLTLIGALLGVDKLLKYQGSFPKLTITVKGEANDKEHDD